jgi:cell division initiation protein
MALTPVEIRHIQLKRGLFGYRKASVHRMMDDIADSFENVWRERSQLVERVEELETEVTRHVELEGLLRSTLVSAERASQDLKETARREADVIVTEANAEARKVMRDAINEKESLMGDVRRVQALLRSALAVVDESPAEFTEAPDVPKESTVPEDHPGWTVENRTTQAAPVVIPQVAPVADPQPEVGVPEEIRKLAG